MCNAKQRQRLPGNPGQVGGPRRKGLGSYLLHIKKIILVIKKQTVGIRNADGLHACVLYLLAQHHH